MKNNKVHLVCNTKNKSKALFPIEDKLRLMKSTAGSFVIAILDICREGLPLRLNEKEKAFVEECGPYEREKPVTPGGNAEETKAAARATRGPTQEDEEFKDL